MFMERKILLIGGNGFIGTNLHEELNRIGKNVVSIDKKDEDLRYSNTVLLDNLKNSTDIFVLASEVGSKSFNNNPLELYQNNKLILDNIYSSIQHVYERYGVKLNVSWFSTSEIYGNINKKDIITNNSYINLDMSQGRTLYSMLKLSGELIFSELFRLNIIKSLNIFRLFNITGKHQRRGVVYDMIKSAIVENKIEYSDKTTRTITDIKYTIKKILETSFSNRNDIKTVNISQSRNSFYMKDLAKFIKKELETNYYYSDIKLIKNKPDKFIQYRHTGIPNMDIIQEHELTSCIGELIDQIEEEQYILFSKRPIYQFRL